MHLLFGFQRKLWQTRDHTMTTNNSAAARPGHQRVPPSQGRRVELEYGGDVVPVGNGHERVHDFVRDVSQSGSQGLLLRVELRAKTNFDEKLTVSGMRLEIRRSQWITEKERKNGHWGQNSRNWVKVLKMQRSGWCNHWWNAIKCLERTQLLLSFVNLIFPI